MKIEIKVPQAGESVTEAMISEWFKEDGETVEKDEAILELETDKANMELNADEGGRLSIAVEAGEVVTVGQVIGHIDTEASGDDGDSSQSDDADSDPDDTEDTAPSKDKQKDKDTQDDTEEAADQDAATASGEPVWDDAEGEPTDATAQAREEDEPILAPAARRVVAEEGLDPAGIKGTGKDGRITKEDALKAAKAAKDERDSQKPKKPQPPKPSAKPQAGDGERVVPMSMMRRRIARNLVEAQQNAALLTTFNEVDMQPVMDLRARYKEAFQKKHGVKLGFMSFFVKACVEGLKEVPEINARIEEQNIIYRDYHNIGVAVGTEKGLVVPVLRDLDSASFADIEQRIVDFGSRARDGKIGLDELSGGTFTISNGGIYGSLLSTPILNPPQSGILGMHKIEKRPVVVDDQIVIRPMMYLALSYDHRIVDGKGAVTFLVKVKECLEDPARMLLEL